MADLNVTDLNNETQTHSTQTHHILTAEDADLFAAALDTPPAPTPRRSKRPPLTVGA